MTDDEKLDTLLESIRLDWKEIADKPLDLQGNSDRKRHIAVCIEELKLLAARLP